MATSKMLVGAALCAIAVSPASAKSLGPKPGEMMGAWEVETLVDGFSDKTRAIAHTELTGGATFVIKCDSQGPGSLYLSIFTETYLGADRIGSRYQFHIAKYRFDDGPPTTFPSPYYDGKSASLLGGKSGTGFLNLLVRTDPKRFRAQFLTYDSQLAEVDLDVTGVSSAVRRAAAICLDTSITG